MFKRILRDQRGTAAAEAAVMLPLMALCWGGLFLRYDHIDRILDAGIFARRDAWAFSANGCSSDPPSRNARLVTHCVSNGSDDGNKDALEIIASIPVVGYLVKTLMGYQLTATGERTYQKSPMFGGGQASTSYPYSVMCNERSRDGGEVLKDVLCQTVRSLGFGFVTGDCPSSPANADDSC